jgi:hypothetical protein
MTPLLSQLLSIVLFITLGFLGGAVAATLWFEREQHKAETESKVDQPQPLRSTAPANLPTPEAEPAAVRAGQHAETTLLREDSSGRLFIQDDQRLVRSAEDLTIPERQKLLQLAAEWMAWLGEVEKPSADQLPATNNMVTIPNRLEPTPASPATVMPLPPQPELPHPEAVLSRVGVVPPPPPLVSPRPTLNGAAKAGKETAEAKPAASSSIVAQIDEVLQTMLEKAPEGTPQIRLSEDPVVGVLVWIGAEHYNGIDGVPDPTVKELIRAAVKEWENHADRSRAQ